MRQLRSSLVVSATLLLAAAPGLAQPPPAADAGIIAEPDAMTETARELFKEGAKLFREKKYALAEAKFEAAWALSKSKGIANNLGESELSLGKFREAAEHLTIARRLVPAAEKERLARIDDLLAQAKAKIGTVVVKANVPGASVTVGGKAAGETPLADPIYVEPGSVTLRVYCDGYVSQEKALDLKAGQEVPLDVTLERPAAPVATVTASPTATAAPTAPPRSKVPAFVLGGVGVASLIAGGVMMGLYEGAKADLRDRMPRDKAGNPLCQRPPVTGTDRPECAALRTKNDEATMLGNGGLALFAVGGIAVAGAAAYFFWPQASSMPSKPASTLAPMVGADGAGVLWTGSF